jgi:hypothetical protein
MHTPTRTARRRMFVALPTAVAVAALIGLPSVASAQTLTVGTSAPAPVLSAPAPTTQGIIMRDGGICDPIRHMGC